MKAKNRLRVLLCPNLTFSEGVIAFIILLSSSCLRPAIAQSRWVLTANITAVKDQPSLKAEDGKIRWSSVR